MSDFTTTRTLIRDVSRKHHLSLGDAAVFVAQAADAVNVRDLCLVHPSGACLPDCAVRRGWHADDAEAILVYVAAEAPRCINAGIDCGGDVEYRMPLSGTGKSFPRCDKHWSDRLDTEDQLRERYPDSPTPPADFDPAFAGETWTEDE